MRIIEFNKYIKFLGQIAPRLNHSAFQISTNIGEFKLRLPNLLTKPQQEHFDFVFQEMMKAE